MFTVLLFTLFSKKKKENEQQGFSNKIHLVYFSLIEKKTFSSLVGNLKLIEQ